MNCPNCGKELLDGVTICDGCGASVTSQPAVPQKPENVVTGTVGALIGAVLGGAAIILLSQLGYVAAISGLILAVCTLKGYELLGGTRSKRGTIICCVLMALTPYFADRIDWAIVITQEFASEGITFAQAYSVVHALIEEADMVGDYFMNLGLVYLFVVLGAFTTIRGMFNKKK